MLLRQSMNGSNLLRVQFDGLSVSLDNGLRVGLTSPVCPFGEHQMSLEWLILHVK